MTERIDLLPLLDLQEVDDKIQRLQGILAALPEETALAEATAEHAEVAPIYQDRFDERARLQSEQQRLEDEAVGLRERLAKEQKRLESGTVTSPREITALQSEIESLSRRISSLEDDELELMETGEAVDKTVAAAKDLVDEAARKVEAAKRSRDEVSASLSEQLQEFQQLRERMLPGIEDKVLERYEKLRKSQGGRVVASFDGKTCAGCGLPLSPASREEFKESNDPWFPCENCRRVLVPR